EQESPCRIASKDADRPIEELPRRFRIAALVLMEREGRERNRDFRALRARHRLADLERAAAHSFAFVAPALVVADVPEEQEIRGDGLAHRTGGLLVESKRPLRRLGG